VCGSCFNEFENNVKYSYDKLKVMLIWCINRLESQLESFKLQMERKDLERGWEFVSKNLKEAIAEALGELGFERK